jgi:DNA-3-methyladenine glycosylase II
LPVDDLGFRKAVQIAYKLRKLPDAKRLAQIAAGWKPYRSIATWYLWASLNNKPLG